MYMLSDPTLLHFSFNGSSTTDNTSQYDITASEWYLEIPRKSTNNNKQIQKNPEKILILFLYIVISVYLRVQFRFQNLSLIFYEFKTIRQKILLSNS